jgi:hypothetical protein
MIFSFLASVFEVVLSLDWALLTTLPLQLFDVVVPPLCQLR